MTEFVFFHTICKLDNSIFLVFKLLVISGGRIFYFKKREKNRSIKSKMARLGKNRVCYRPHCDQKK